MFLKRLLSCILSILILVGITLASSPENMAVLDWSGTWYGKDGAAISISQKDGFVDVLGKDGASIYSCIGIIEETTSQSVQCEGSGMNQVLNARFIYRSNLKLTADGKTLEENWEAGFVNGKEIKWLKGKTTFTRKQK